MMLLHMSVCIMYTYETRQDITMRSSELCSSLSFAFVSFLVVRACAAQIIQTRLGLAGGLVLACSETGPGPGLFRDFVLLLLLLW